MPLTPEDVASRKFTVTRLGRSGYDEAEVDEFLDEVEAELTRLYGEVDRLQAQLGERGQATPQPAASQAAPQPAGSQGAPASAAAAQPPEMQATGILALAQRTAEEHMADARAQAETILGNARALAEQRKRELDERRREMLGNLEQEQATLQQAVEELRAFERRYRSQLRDYLQGQLSQLETGGDGSGQSRSAVATAGPAFATFGATGTGTVNSGSGAARQQP